MAREQDVKRFLSTHDFSRNYQRIALGHGYHTPGTDRSNSYRAATAPIDMEGKTYLDIGCMWGAMAFLAEGEGASVTGWDVHKEFVDIATDIAHLKDGGATFRQIDIVTHEPVGQFDVVSMYNVIHHLRHPFRALNNALGATREYFIIEFPTLKGRFLNISDVEPRVAKIAQPHAMLGIISKETGLYFTAHSMEIAVNWFGKWETVVSQQSPYRKDRLLMTFRRK